MTSPIQVLAIRKLDGKSTVKAFVDVQLGGVTIKGAKVIRQDGQRPWLGMPGTKTNHGWQNTIELSKDLRQRVTDVVLEAWEQQQQDRPPAHEAARGEATAQALDERAEAWSKRQRDERVQELADRFVPDEEPPF